nr:PEP-CTERM sorting domain-containing protein [uncultured Duganella sp.]
MTSFKTLTAKALLACAAVVSTHAHATTVDFEDVPAYTQEDFSSNGFDFILVGEGSNVTPTGSFCSPQCPDNGSQYVVAPYGLESTSLTMTRTGGGLFGLSSFDGAGTFNFGDGSTFIPNQIDVTGVLVSGGTVYQSFQIDKSTGINGGLNFTSYAFSSSFTNLVSVRFTSSGSDLPHFNGFSVDNINAKAVSAVPEAETYAMLLAGLGMMGFIARRRKA